MIDEHPSVNDLFITIRHYNVRSLVLGICFKNLINIATEQLYHIIILILTRKAITYCCIKKVLKMCNN